MYNEWTHWTMQVYLISRYDFGLYTQPSLQSVRHSVKNFAVETTYKAYKSRNRDSVDLTKAQTDSNYIHVHTFDMFPMSDRTYCCVYIRPNKVKYFLE